MKRMRRTELDGVLPLPCQGLHLLTGWIGIFLPLTGSIRHVLFCLGIVVVAEELLGQVGGL